MWGCFWGELPHFWRPSPLCLFAVPPINSRIFTLGPRVSSTLLSQDTASLHPSGAPENFPSFFFFFFTFFLYFFFLILFLSFLSICFSFPHSMSLRPSPPAKPQRQNGRRAAILWEPAAAAGSSVLLCLPLPAPTVAPWG